MYIAGLYSFNNGYEYLLENHQHLLREIFKVIESIDANNYKTKVSNEKTNKGMLLYNPPELNTAFSLSFKSLNWNPYKIKCNYPTSYYTDDYHQKSANYTPTFRNASREIDFLKNRVGIEVQFGKYAFMAYDILGKMSILNKQYNLLDVGIEIVPVRKLTTEMSTGVSYFEQIVWDLEMRGASNLDIPVLIIGIDA